MKINNITKITLSLLALAATINFPLQARELRDGTRFFEKSPRLIEAFTTFSDAGVWGAKYYFTLHLPENAGEPLEKITVQQRQGLEDIKFRIDRTFAFVGQPNRKQEAIAIQQVDRDRETQAITLTFDPPIEPGTTFSFALKPQKNPKYGGVYIFGVTAYPAGSQSNGTYLGIGRFHFYHNGESFN